MHCPPPLSVGSPANPGEPRDSETVFGGEIDRSSAWS